MASLPRLWRVRSSTLKRPRSFIASVASCNHQKVGISSYVAPQITQSKLTRSSFSTSSGNEGVPSQNISNSNEDNESPMLASDKLRPIYDTSTNWEDWFSPEEYGDPWEFPDNSSQPASPNPSTQSASSNQKRLWRLEPLEGGGDEALDSQSRYLIRQLQLIYQDGYCQEEITTSRCHFTIKALLESADQIAKSPAYKGQGDNGATLLRQRILRAEAILRTMELFWDYIPDLLDFQEVNAKYNYYPPQPTTTKNQRIVTHWMDHKPVVQWPLPTSQTYTMIARGLNSLRFPKQYQKIQNDDVPWICQDVILRLHRFHKQKGMVYLENPSVELFNQALSAWANAHGDRDHPQKAFHAAQFFMDMKLTLQVTPDASSYAHVLRACGHHDENETAKELGAKTALKFWKGVLRDELQQSSLSFTPTPQLFVFAFRALGLLWEFDSQEHSKSVKEVWEEACRHGVVNEHVLYEFEHASRFLFREELNSYREKVDTHKLQTNIKDAYDKSYHHDLMQLLPEKWTKNARGGGERRW